VVLGPHAPHDGEYKELREEVWIPYGEKSGWLERNVEVTVSAHRHHSDYDKACEDMQKNHLDLLFKYVNELPRSSFASPAGVFHQGKWEAVELSQEDLMSDNGLSTGGRAWRDFAMRLAEAVFPGLQMPLEPEMSSGHTQKAILLAVAREHQKVAPVKITDKDALGRLRELLKKSVSPNTLNEAKTTYGVPRGPDWWKWVIENIRDDDTADS
jgi:hypothetical protein